MLVLQYGTKLPESKPDGPIMGEPSRAPGARADSGTHAAAAARKETEPPYVVSGMVRGENEIIGQGAVFDVPVRKGRVIAFTFDPLHRFLNHHDFPMVWNAILNWNAHPDASGAATVSASVNPPR